MLNEQQKAHAEGHHELTGVISTPNPDKSFGNKLNEIVEEVISESLPGHAGKPLRAIAKAYTFGLLLGTS